MNGNRRMYILVPAAALLMFLLPAASLAAAQAPSTAMPTVQPTPSPAVNTAALAKEAEGWLADLIRIDTTNPPGNEEATAKYIAALLTKEGLTPELLELAAGRSALVARLRSAAADGCRTTPADRPRFPSVLAVLAARLNRSGRARRATRTAFVATLLALSRRDAEPLALAQNQCCAAGRNVTQPALAPEFLAAMDALDEKLEPLLLQFAPISTTPCSSPLG